MQMQLPLFPSSTKLINSNIGIFEKDDLSPTMINLLIFKHISNTIY